LRIIPDLACSVLECDLLRLTHNGLGGPAYSITLSARARIDGGMVRPSAFGVLRFMTSSNLVGYRTGSSLGLALSEAGRRMQSLRETCYSQSFFILG
jgi:hypothetical protein